MRFVLILGALCAGLLALPVRAADDAYLGELIERSRAMGLAERQEWHKLGHYEPRAWGRGYESLADSDNFFLSPRGKQDPQAELEATLARLISGEPDAATGQDPQCRFPARYRWLDTQLGFDPQRIVPQPCERFETWAAAIDAAQATLVFPAAYLNSPSSMFGHTLLRLDRPGDSTARLGSYAINYAAQTTETNGLVFAIRGLTGGYPGSFSVMPYYEKVNEYSALENRDIWEYELDFSPEEIRRMLEHAWELGPVTFDYYFFDENCSYMLLSLLEVGRPGMTLTDGFGLYAIPADTVRAVLEQENILRRVVYRPSNQTQIAHRIRFLEAEQQRLALALADGSITPQSPAFARLDPRAQARVLDVASRYVQFRAGAAGDTTAVRTRYLELLGARSRLAPGDDLPPVARPAARPDEGHGSGRLAFGFGEAAGDGFLSLRVRPAYHDLMDAQAGFTPGAQINFLDSVWRLGTDGGALRLHALELVDIFSISPRNRFFKPVSWRAQATLERMPLFGDKYQRVFTLRAGGGLSYVLGDALVFGLAQGSVMVDDALDRQHALGAGPMVGLLWTPRPKWSMWLSSRVEAFESHADLTFEEHRLEQNFVLYRNLAIRASFERRGPRDALENTAEISLRWYF